MLFKKIILNYPMIINPFPGQKGADKNPVIKQAQSQKGPTLEPRILSPGNIRRPAKFIWIKTGVIILQGDQAGFLNPRNDNPPQDSRKLSQAWKVKVQGFDVGRPCLLMGSIVAQRESDSPKGHRVWIRRRWFFP